MFVLKITPNIMKNENNTPKEQLDLIEKMISQAKVNLSRHSFDFIFWGWLVSLTAVSNFLLLTFTSLGYKSYLIWPLSSAFLYASNFSIGVNLFFKLNEDLAKLMKSHKSYAAEMKEIHHIHKLDAPSGTAITLAEGVFKDTDYNAWTIEEAKNQKTLPIVVERTGEVPGTHAIKYKSKIDSITIEHEAHAREGFALGAVVSAEWIQNKKGIFSMKDVLNIG